MSIFSFGHAKNDAVGAGFSSTPGFNQWSSSPRLFTSRPQIDFLEQAQAAVAGTSLSESQEQIEAASSRTKANMATSRTQIENKFSTPIGAQELFSITDKSFRLVLAMQKVKDKLPALYDDEKKTLSGYGIRLMELRALAKLMRDKPNSIPIKTPLPPGSEWSNEFKSNVVAPYTIATAALDKAVAAKAHTVAVLQTPVQVVDYLGDVLASGVRQVGKAAGLPPWFIPVLLGGVAIAAAASVVGSVKSFVPHAPKGATA